MDGINTEIGEKGFGRNQSPGRNSWRPEIYVFRDVTNRRAGPAMRGEPSFKWAYLRSLDLKFIMLSSQSHIC